MWEVQWAEACTHQVRAMHWRLAGEICGKVLDFAETGRGNIARIQMGDPGRFRIWMPGAAADVRVDREAKTLSVIRVFEVR